MADEKTIQGLQQAVQLSPENIPLRMLLADAYSRTHRYDDAEFELREALKHDPVDRNLRLALAQCFFDNAKNSEALVLVESLLDDDEWPAASILCARLHLRLGDHRNAAFHYRTAVDCDPDTANEVLAEQLGISPDGRWEPDEEDDEEEDRRLRLSSSSASDFDSSTVEFERPDSSFENVGGMETIKDEIRLKIIHPLTHPEIYEAYGKQVGGGILMYGPPGCGKTHLARATAGEVEAGFMSIGIHDVLDMWIGNSEKHLHQIFERARSQTPCVLFFDEVDALGASRTDMKSSAGRHLINQFLAELDGIDQANNGLLILAATNAPWHLDSAFRRPGRFDRVIFVPPPDAEGRSAILRILLSGKPVDRIDYDHVARKTDQFSGADLESVVDIAIESKLQQAMVDGIPKPLTTKDLTKAARQVRPSTTEWFSTARNYAMFSNESGAYDDILEYLNIRP